MPDPRTKPTANPDQETRNDDPNVQDQREQKASGAKDEAEGKRRGAADERIPGSEPDRATKEGGERKGGPR